MTNWVKDFEKWLSRKGGCTCKLNTHTKRNCFECYKKLFHPNMVFPELNSISQFKPFLAKLKQEGAGDGDL